MPKTDKESPPPRKQLSKLSSPATPEPEPEPQARTPRKAASASDPQEPPFSAALDAHMAASQRESEAATIVGRAHLDRDARAARRAIAQDTVAFCEQGWYPSPGDGSQLMLPVVEAVGATQLYRAGATLPPLPRQPPATATTSLQVVQGGVIAVAEALTSIAPDERVGVLNFASARHPGGGFLKGANAQEESIARCTALYPCLTSKAAAAYYADNSDRAVKGIYTDAAIISPSVPLFRHESGALLPTPREICVVTCPAPNLGALNDKAEAAVALRRRMTRVLQLFAAAGSDTVVLGAWGCGVFRHDPVHVAAQWQQLLGTGGQFAGLFRRVIFAVLDTATCDVFRSSLDQIKVKVAK